jgi:hypothetical protein
MQHRRRRRERKRQYCAETVGETRRNKGEKNEMESGRRQRDMMKENKTEDEERPHLWFCTLLLCGSCTNPDILIPCTSSRRRNIFKTSSVITVATSWFFNELWTFRLNIAEVSVHRFTAPRVTCTCRGKMVNGCRNREMNMTEVPV